MSDDKGSKGMSEVAKLRRDTRVLTEQKKTIQNESTVTLRKQEAMLSTLTKDNANLKRQVEIAEQEMGDMLKMKEKAATLNLQYEGYTAEIKNEQARVATLDQETFRIRKELKKARTSRAKALNDSFDKVAAERHIQRLEGRVKKSTNLYDTQLAHNSKLRATIDHLTKERKTFAALRAKLDTELEGQKTTMASLTDTANQAHEARNEALMKMSLLTEKTEKEQTQSSLELKELNRVLEHERSLKEFMGKKGRSRQQELAEAEALRRKKLDAAVKPAQLIEQYDNAFNTMKEITGIQDNTQLVDTFIETEIRNFSLFNLVSELNNNIESIREQINDTQAKIKQFKSDGQRTGEERKTMLTELEQRLEIAESKRNEFAKLANETKEQVEELKKMVSDTFDSIGCSASAFDQSLGEKEVDESNVMRYMGIIEQRANELLSQLTMINVKATQKWEDEAHRLILENATLGADGIRDFDPATQLAEKPPAPAGLLGVGPKVESLGPIEPPSVVDDEEEDDTDDIKPLSLEEMRSKIRGGQ